MNAPIRQVARAAIGPYGARYASLPVLLMTAYGEIDRAVAAMRAGACNYLAKPFEPDQLVSEVARWMRPAAFDREGEVIAADPATRNVLDLASRVAQTDATVLLTGESGVGKEVFARYIHRNSQRANQPFVAISSYFLVGQEQRMSSTHGELARLRIPYFRRLQQMQPVARPGSSIFIFTRAQLDAARRSE